MGRRHLTPKEIINQCKIVSRESRMADRTPWTLASIMCAYGCMKSEHFSGQKINKLINRVECMQNEYESGKLDLDKCVAHMKEKSDIEFIPKDYTEKDLIWKKGTYQYWFDKTQIEAQNAMNRNMVRYILFFLTALEQECGYGKKRLQRVFEYITDLMPDYQNNYSLAVEWQDELLEKTGLVFEMPVDPDTNTRGSIMTGL